jgi:mannosyltransferase
MITPIGTRLGVKRGEFRAVGALTIVALIIRLIGSNSGLWVDEIYSLLDSFRPPLVQIVTLFPRDNHHPLYSVFAHLSISAFGEAPWSARLPSVLFGAATIPLLYVLGRQVTSSREALLASALLAVSYHHVWFSQNARGYVMLAFFTIACCWLLLRLVDERSTSFAVAYAAAAALGAYTHLTMVFVVIGQAFACVVLLVHRRREGAWSRWGPSLMKAFTLSAFGTLLLYAPVLFQVREYFLHRPSGMRGISTPGWAFLETLRVLALGFGAGNLAIGAGIVAVATMLFTLGLVSYAKKNVFSLALFVCPAIVILAGALVARGTFYPRFLFALIGFGILVGVRGVMVSAAYIEYRWANRRAATAEPYRLGTALMAITLVLSFVTLKRNYRYPKQDFVGAARYLDARRSEGEAVATTGVAVRPFRDYLLRDWTEVVTAADLQRLRGGRPVWLVYTFPRYLAQTAPEIMAIADQSCRNAQVFQGTIGGGDIIVCKLEPSA